MTATRVLTASILAVALLSLALPAVDAAREDRTDSRVRTELDRVERAGNSLLTDGATAAGVPGARRALAVSVPRASWSAAPVEYVAFGDVPRDGGGAVVSYRLRDRPPRAVRLDVPAIRTPDGPVVLGPGRHRLSLALVRDPAAGVAVVVRAP